MVWYNKSFMRRILIVLLAIILAALTAQAVFINMFNQRVHNVVGADESQEAYLDLHERGDATSSWVKRDYNLNGETVDLYAQTLDGTFFNNSADLVNSWTLTISITEDCFINNSWCGTVEIHQFVGTNEEAVQTLDLRDYDIEEVKLAHLYDGDLLIPLKKGDYLVYYPSAKDNELEIAPNSELTMGIIFYYRDVLDMSQYELDYYYHRDITYGWGFIAIVALAIIWLALLAGMKVADLSYKRALKEMELRKSGLTSMSSIYSIISFIDLVNDEIIHVYASPTTKGDIPQGIGAREQLLEVFRKDTAEPYSDIVLEFVDTATLPQRLERESIACEYVSKSYGWSKVRFFAVDREEGKPLERVLFTIQDINDEKHELERFEERADQAELESRARNVLVAGVSNGMRPPLQAIRGLAESISNETGDEQIQSYARQIDNRGKLLSYMLDNAGDFSMLAAGGLDRSSAEYSLQAVVSDVCAVAAASMEGSELSFATDISPSVHDRLMGDGQRIERMLACLFAYAIRCAESGTVTLSVFGKAIENVEHLLFSVRVSGRKMAEEEMEALASFVDNIGKDDGRSVIGTAQELEVVAVLLAFMGSKLQVINDPGEGCEFYFEIEQQIAETASLEGGN